MCVYYYDPHAHSSSHLYIQIQPIHSFLNRGNHEDPGVCVLFGFLRECLEKYDEMTFSMFMEVRGGGRDWVIYTCIYMYVCIWVSE